MPILRFLLFLLYRLMPRANHAVVYGWPDHEDNQLALELGLRNTRLTHVVLLMSDPEAKPPMRLGGKTLQVRKNSIRGLWWFLTAKYVFFTHPCFVRSFPRDVVSVSVWHGMPIKKIGTILGQEGIRSKHVLATSPFWARIMETSMTPWMSALDTGLPRNDRLFLDRSEVLRTLGIADDQRLVVWLPTFRQSVRGQIRIDGHEYHNPFSMPDIDPETLNAFLAAHNCMLLVKPHPMAAFDSAQNESHLKVVDPAWLPGLGLSLYQTLAASDALISDISSVVIDYLLLDRPIIHAFPDITEYHQSRGFSLEPIEDYFCGPVATNQHELMDCLELILKGQDPDAEKRHKMRELSHSHKDNQATQRLLQTIGLS